MASSLCSSPRDTILQLEKARRLALGDPTHYGRIIPSILPVVGPQGLLELRRWGSGLIVEALSCPSLPSDQKQQLALTVVKTLKEYLEKPSEDATVVKNVVQAATSAYPIIFKYIIANRNDETTWQTMLSIKSNILRREQSAPSGVRVCCVKFIQRIVQVQTPGLIDPRRSEQDDISQALVPNDHPLIPPGNLQAEAYGLLDRMLSVFQDRGPRNALLITATLNSLGILIRTRAAVANRILNVLSSFNPFQDAGPNASLRTKLAVKSMERTVRALLMNLNKRNPSGPMAGRISGYLDHLLQLRAEVFEERGKKRSPPVEPTDGLDSAKRQRLGADVPEVTPSQLAVSSLPPGGRCTLAQMFTLTNDEFLRGFDAQRIPLHILQQITLPLLRAPPPQQFSQAIDAVHARLQHLKKLADQPVSPAAAAQDAFDPVDDDEEYSPEEGAEQLINRIEKVPEPAPAPPAVNLAPFVIPQPPPLSEEEISEYGKGTVARVFAAISDLQAPKGKPTRTGFNRVAAGDYDRDSWITIVARLATRPLAGLGVDGTEIKTEAADGTVSKTHRSVADDIREALLRYVLDDWRNRLELTIGWLNEEWYNDKTSGDAASSRYETLALRVFDGFQPYLDVKDNKHLIRFLSEIPSISDTMMNRVERLAQDPERISLVVSSVFYLILYRPPVRQGCLDVMENLYKTYEESRAQATKILKKWRPAALQAEAETTKTEDADVKDATPAQTQSATPA